MFSHIVGDKCQEKCCKNLETTISIITNTVWSLFGVGNENIRFLKRTLQRMLNFSKKCFFLSTKNHIFFLKKNYFLIFQNKLAFFTFFFENLVFIFTPDVLLHCSSTYTCTHTCTYTCSCTYLSMYVCFSTYLSMHLRVHVSFSYPSVCNYLCMQQPTYT